MLANVTKGSIDTAAIAIDGSIGIISGVITGDDEQINRGETQVVKAGRRVLRGTVMSISNTGKSVRDVVSGDVVRVKRGVKSLVTKTAAVSISLLLPGAFDLDFDIDSDFVIDEQDPGIHHVEPQDVQGYTKADGTEVEGYHRGGETGYLRTDPDDDPDNNFS